MTNFSGRVNGLIGGTLPWSFGFGLTATISEAQVSTSLTSATTALFTTATNGLQNFMSTDVTVTGTVVSTLNSTFHQTTATRATLSIAGTDANPSLPWHVAEVVTLRSALATKSGHGRIYLPPFAEDQIAAHVIKAATVTSMVTVFNTFFNTLQTAGISLYIYNKRPLKDGTPAYTQRTLLTFDVPNKPARQARRVSKVVPTRVAGTI